MKVDAAMLKKAGAALIVLAAVVIMAPGIFSFAAGLVRMIGIIAGALLLAIVLVFAWRYLSGKRKTDSQEEEVAAESNGKSKAAGKEVQDAH